MLIIVYAVGELLHMVLIIVYHPWWLCIIDLSTYGSPPLWFAFVRIIVSLLWGPFVLEHKKIPAGCCMLVHFFYNHC